MRIQRFAFTLLLFLSLPLFARENTDVIVMKNGDRLTGQIKGLGGGELYVGLGYVIQTLSVDWSKVARIESRQLFIVGTADGSVYKGTIKSRETEGATPLRIEVVEASEKHTAIDRDQVVQIAWAADKFLQRFNGAVSFGTTFSKGNENIQYTASSQVAYVRERWTAAVKWSSNLSSSSGTTVSTRNEVTPSGQHLLSWSNWFYGGLGDFLQSSEQGINFRFCMRI